MVYYIESKPRVYLETTVISYLVARPNRDVFVASMQQITQQLWENYTDEFTYVVSPIVFAEARQGDANAVHQRLHVLSHLTTLEVLPDAVMLAEKLLDAGAVPKSSRSDAQHIAIATTHGVEYLVSWNQKHIVNEYKREHINQVCRNAGFSPITICTPTELMREFQMKEKEFEKYTDPILEECYRMKEEFNAKFDSLEELTAHLIQVQEECRRNGMKVVSYYVPPSERKKGLASTDAEALDETSQQ